MALGGGASGGSMNGWTRRLPRRRGDHGFTLVEVIVALLLLALILSSATALFIRSIKSSAEINRRDYAVTLAQQGMELARGVSAQYPGTPKLNPGNPSFYTGLATGRAQVDATAQQTALAPLFASQSFNPVAESTPAYDLTVPVGGPSVSPALPFSTTSVQSNAGSYTTSTYLGYCELKFERRSRDARTERDCVRTAVLNAGEEDWGIAKLVRVLVVVSWNSPDCRTASACFVSLESLIDPATNEIVFQRGVLTAEAPVWDAPDPDAPTLNLWAPYDTPLVFEGVTGTPPPPVTDGIVPRLTFTVLVNATPVVQSGADIVEFVDRLETTIPESSNPNCSGSTATPTGITTITFDPAAGTLPDQPCFGPVTFQYVAVDVWGRRSAEVSVTVDVRPPPPTAPNRTAATTWPSAVTTGVVSTTTPPVVHPTSGTFRCLSATGATRGTASCSGDGSSVVYTPGSWPGGTSAFVETVTYQVQDSYGQASNAATLSVTVNPPPPPVAPNIVTSAPWPGTTTQINVVSGVTPTGGTYSCAQASGATAGSVTCSGSNVAYTPPATWPGGTATTYLVTFAYQVTDALGQLSNVALVSLTLNKATPPVAPNLSVTTTWPQPIGVNVVSGVTPSGGSYACAFAGPATSGSAGCTSSSTATYTPGAWTVGNVSSYTVTFPYQVVDGAGTPSNTATVTVRVNRPAPPQARSDSATVVRNSRDNLIDVLANDTLPTGRGDVVVTVTGSSNDARCSYYVSNNNIVFTSTSRRTGTINVYYTVRDGTGQASSSLVAVRVI